MRLRTVDERILIVIGEAISQMGLHLQMVLKTVDTLEKYKDISEDKRIRMINLPTLVTTWQSTSIWLVIGEFICSMDGSNVI